MRLPSEVSPEVSPDPSSLVSVESRIRSHMFPIQIIYIYLPDNKVAANATLCLRPTAPATDPNE